MEHPQQTTLNFRGRLLDVSRPAIMGILNMTPDSFYASGRVSTVDAVLQQAEKMLEDGAAILDIGGASSRPGAAEVREDDEKKRVLPAIEALATQFPQALLSIDTWRAGVALEAVAAGAHMINDISAGKLDQALYPALQKISRTSPTPYVLMHMQGTPKTMQQNPEYTHVVQDVLDFFIREVTSLRALGVTDIVLDPGFGFGKSTTHNFQLLKNLRVFSSILSLPILAGLSRKSMICKVLHVSPDRALNGTTALHVLALQQGANLLRVHDVREAQESILLWEQWEQV